MRLTFLAVLFTLPAAAQTLPGFSTANMDLTADPCQNFYQYACGTWMAKHPIPADQSRWGVLALINDRNRAVLQNILEKAAVSDAKRTPDEQKIGDFYASCMDEPAIEKLGTKPLQPDLDRIHALAAKSAVAQELARLHLQNVAALFRFSSSPDYKNSDVNIAEADQGGLGLPDRDYYLKDDPRSTEVRAHYLAHVQKMLELLGEAPGQAQADAQANPALRNPARQGIARSRIAARALQDLSQTHAPAALRAHAGFLLADLLDGPRHARLRRSERRSAGLLQSPELDPGGDRSRRHQDLPPLAPGPRRRRAGNVVSRPWMATSATRSAANSWMRPSAPKERPAL
ncbi:MAG: M13 family metallopeptidase [Acidobacteriia bacterium]|nr:M13 family metallopeptidase [Terriglobia bacterium]